MICKNKKLFCRLKNRQENIYFPSPTTDHPMTTKPPETLWLGRVGNAKNLKIPIPQKQKNLKFKQKVKRKNVVNVKKFTSIG